MDAVFTQFKSSSYGQVDYRDFNLKSCISVQKNLLFINFFRAIVITFHKELYALQDARTVLVRGNKA